MDKQISPGSFSDVIVNLRGGRLHDELNEQLKEVVNAARATGKAGSLSINLTVKVSGAGSDYTMEVSDKIKQVIPEPAKKGSIMFATQEGRLIRDEPKQETLPLGDKVTTIK